MTDALVTGSSRGIGAAIVRHLARAGHEEAEASYITGQVLAVNGGLYT